MDEILEYPSNRYSGLETLSTMSRTLNASTDASPLADVLQLPQTVAQALKSPAIIAGL